MAVSIVDPSTYAVEATHWALFRGGRPKDQIILAALACRIRLSTEEHRWIAIACIRELAAMTDSGIYQTQRCLQRLTKRGLVEILTFDEWPDILRQLDIDDRRGLPHHVPTDPLNVAYAWGLKA
jgi:hypothetical protein